MVSLREVIWNTFDCTEQVEVLRRKYEIGKNVS